MISASRVAACSSGDPNDEAAKRKFQEINEANEVLGDSAKRRKYDELGANWRQYEQQPGAGRPGGFRGPGGFGGGGTSRTMSAEEMAQLFGDETPFSDFFSTFFGGVPGLRLR